MKRILTILFSFALSLFAMSCESEDVAFTLSDNKLTFESDATQSQSLTVDATNVEWKVDVESIYDWLTAVKTNNTVVISVNTNYSMQERVGIVVITPTSNADKVKPLSIVVTQKGSATPPVYDITFSPTSLEFAAVDSPAQQITVTTIGEGVTWTVDSSKSWLITEAVGDKINVTVEDYNFTNTSRDANVIITANKKEIPNKVIHVIQQPIVQPTSLSVGNPGPIKFEYDLDEKILVTIPVVAVNVEWNVTVKDSNNNAVDWLTASKVSNDKKSEVVVKCKQNLTGPERSCKIIISPDEAGIAAGVEAITVIANQDKTKPMSDLTGPVTLKDGLWNQRAVIYPTQSWSKNKSTLWNIRFLGEGMTWNSKPEITGEGARIELYVRSSRIEFNSNNEYDLPVGEYTVGEDSNDSPFIIVKGQKSTNYFTPNRSWYLSHNNNNFINKAPISGGKMTVTKKGFNTTIVFDFTDDAGNPITGTYKGELSIIKSGQPIDNPNGGTEPPLEPDPDPVPPEE